MTGWWRLMLVSVGQLSPSFCFKRGPLMVLWARTPVFTTHWSFAVLTIEIILQPPLSFHLPSSPSLVALADCIFRGKCKRISSFSMFAGKCVFYSHWLTYDLMFDLAGLQPFTVSINLLDARYQSLLSVPEKFLPSESIVWSLLFSVSGFPTFWEILMCFIKFIRRKRSGSSLSCPSWWPLRERLQSSSVILAYCQDDNRPLSIKIFSPRMHHVPSDSDSLQEVRVFSAVYSGAQPPSRSFSCLDSRKTNLKPFPYCLISIKQFEEWNEGGFRRASSSVWTIYRPRLQ